MYQSPGARPVEDGPPRPQRLRHIASASAFSPLVHKAVPSYALPMAPKSFFHLHMVSDSTGETLITVGRAVAAQYPAVSALEHVYPMVRSERQLDQVIAE